jgi:hypothetical protein
MKVILKDDLIVIDRDDLPEYKKGGSVVRNSYFWALKSISCYSGRNCNWEFDREVWVALTRMLLLFAQSGYLGHSETVLEFPDNMPIPDILRSISTYI